MKKIILFKKEFKPLEIAPWAKAELRRKSLMRLLNEFFLHVRFVFILLLIATVFIFVTNNEVDLEVASSAELQRALKHYTLSEKLRQRALDHEKEVNAINEPQNP